MLSLCFLGLEVVQRLQPLSRSLTLLLPAKAWALLEADSQP